MSPTLYMNTMATASKCSILWLVCLCETFPQDRFPEPVMTGFFATNYKHFELIGGLVEH